MKVRVSEIKVRERIRQDVGDIKSLADSIQKYGLLQPILIDLDYNLIAGYRRYLAVRSLGWEFIEVRILDLKSQKDRYLLELEENKHRLEFSDKEIELSTQIMERYAENNFLYTLKKIWTYLWRKSNESN
ncbi:MAG: ParB N-terminal domain-containing protein [Leptospiraceae bacterium]|nr:ParB N-terminal domain-containing protein [Leptospiraceae bacterium]